ncbi:MAG: redoxin domain-containing protein [Polyangiaceae bacterium]
MRRLAWYHLSVRFVAGLAFALSSLLALGACSHTAPAASAQSSPAVAPAVPPGVAPSSASKTPKASPEPPVLDDPDAPAWLGVELATRTTEDAGVLVRAVVPGSPAERAGVLAGDVIVSVEGQNVAKPSELVAQVSGRHPGERVALAVSRQGASRLLGAELEPMPNEESLMKKRYLDSPAPSLGNLKAVQGNAEPNWRALRGRVVVVEFWASWCGPCRLTAPLLTSWSDRHGAEGLSVLGITSDPVEIAADGARRASMSYSVFSDEAGDTVRSFRAYALPTLFVVDRRGLVRDVVVGYSSSRLREVDQLLTRLLLEH